MNVLPCPECRTEIDAEAQVCPHCTERVRGVRCTECLARSPQGAAICRWCGSRFKSAADTRIPKKLEIVASSLGAFLLNLSLRPPKVFISQEKIVVTHYSFFGLIEHSEELPWNKVAGFQHRSGFIWDAISIETRGQSAATVPFLLKEDAQTLKKILQTLEK